MNEVDSFLMLMEFASLFTVSIIVVINVAFIANIIALIGWGRNKFTRRKATMLILTAVSMSALLMAAFSIAVMGNAAGGIIMLALGLGLSIIGWGLEFLDGRYAIGLILLSIVFAMTITAVKTAASTIYQNQLKQQESSSIPTIMPTAEIPPTSTRPPKIRKR